MTAHPEWDKRVARLYEQGNSTPEIGRLLDVSTDKVYKALKRQHVELRSMSEALVLAKRSPLHEQVLAGAGACGSPKCADPECPVAPGHCHRPGCPNMAATPHHTQLGKREVKGLPLMYCSPACAQLPVQAAEFSVGGCGSPTCTDARCSVLAGQCHRPGCDRPAVIARESIRVYRWVEGYPKLYCSPACARALGVAAIARQHAEEMATLESEGLVPAVKAARLVGRDPRSPSDLEPLLTLERRKFGRKVRQGANARAVLSIATDGDAQSAHAVRAKLTNPLSALKGTKVGAPHKLSADEENYAAKRQREGAGLRTIADELTRVRLDAYPSSVSRKERRRISVTYETVRAALRAMPPQ